uniref:Uncharacterized protein n=1 Tax=Tanacetum cinerariifolium TaxID=118510 RepID=A0A699IZ55_TANCI|nr:hypothetical protein [Tanacetum cinerariifolium]
MIPITTKVESGLSYYHEDSRLEPRLRVDSVATMIGVTDKKIVGERSLKWDGWCGWIHLVFSERKEVAGRGGRRKKVTGHGARRKKVAGREGRRKKVNGKGGRHEEGVWSVEPDLFRSEGRRWKKVKEESAEKVG